MVVHWLWGGMICGGVWSQVGWEMPICCPGEDLDSLSHPMYILRECLHNNFSPCSTFQFGLPKHPRRHGKPRLDGLTPPRTTRDIAPLVFLAAASNTTVGRSPTATSIDHPQSRWNALLSNVQGNGERRTPACGVSASPGARPISPGPSCACALEGFSASHSASSVLSAPEPTVCPARRHLLSGTPGKTSAGRPLRWALSSPFPAACSPLARSPMPQLRVDA